MNNQEQNSTEAFIEFKKRMAEITKRQLVLFLKVDKIITEEKAKKIREKINN